VLLSKVTPLNDSTEVQAFWGHRFDYVEWTVTHKLEWFKRPWLSHTFQIKPIECPGASQLVKSIQELETISACFIRIKYSNQMTSRAIVRQLELGGA
jgi:hypothetical protein